jgi:hypothetical protein
MAKVGVDRITAVGLIKNNMRQAAIDRAFEAFCIDCQTHCASPVRLDFIGIASEQPVCIRLTGPVFPCAWKLE